MDAIKFIQEYTRMCNQEVCCECPMNELLKKYGVEVCEYDFVSMHPEEVVCAVDKWSDTH